MNRRWMMYLTFGFILYSFSLYWAGEYSGSHANLGQMMADQKAAMAKANDALAACTGGVTPAAQPQPVAENGAQQ